MAVLAVRPPNARFVAVVAGVLALLAGISSGLWEARTAGELAPRIGVWVLLDLVAAGVVALTVAAFERAVPRRLFLGPPVVLAVALSYGAHVVAGLAGGLARRWAGTVPPLRPEGPWPWNHHADVGSVMFATVLLGVVANQYAAFRERVGAQERALQAQVEELQRSRRQITGAEERVRREIAELLHSRVQTRLLVAWHRLGECERVLETDPVRAGTVLTEVRTLLDEIREQEVRQASHVLHPSIIRVGLAPAIRSLLAHTAAPIDVTLAMDPSLARLDDPGQNAIPEPVRLVAYRVVEEALNNVYRHAAAGHAAVSLAVTDDGRLEVIVRDDGRGFDAERLQPGLGLGSIDAWVGQVGGTIRLASGAGGTTLRVALPMAPGDTERPATVEERAPVGARSAPAERSWGAQPTASPQL